MDVFLLASDHIAAQTRANGSYAVLAKELSALLPSACNVLHVGATAIPGCLTKGDLDLVVRCEPTDFATVDQSLARCFDRNEGSFRSDAFSAFETTDRELHIGIQLTAKGGELDVFHHFADALRSDPTLVRRYNDLKRAFVGKRMDDYRIAKDEFIRQVIEG